MVIQMQRWMVAWTRPNAEALVVGKLREIGLDAFMPAIRKERAVARWTRPRGRNIGRVRQPTEIVLVPAFPRYVMFAATELQPTWQLAVRVDGVSMVVRQAGNREAAGILPHKVAQILRGPNGDGIIKDEVTVVEEMTRFARDAEIVVTSGPFTNFPGVVVGHEGRNVRVLLSILGGHREAHIAPEAIRLAVA